MTIVLRQQFYIKNQNQKKETIPTKKFQRDTKISANHLKLIILPKFNLIQRFIYKVLIRPANQKIVFSTL